MLQRSPRPIPPPAARRPLLRMLALLLIAGPGAWALAKLRRRP